jgi:GxxExxY protein
MHLLYSEAAELTHGVIGAAIEVYRGKGPGLLESIYEWCMSMALELRGYSIQKQDSVVVHDKEFRREYPLRFDLLVNSCLLVEGKAVETVPPIHQAQSLSYMKLLDLPRGLLINFHEQKLIDGVSR